MRLHAITSAEKTKVTAITTGVSLANMELMIREPMPGTRKICSVTMAPPKMAGICKATKVTTGIIALRSTCLVMTTFSDKPLERAVVT